MAEGVFRSLTKSNPRIGDIDSAGSGAWHLRDPPDPRTMEELEKNGITDYDHGARKVNKNDFDRFDYVFAMDAENLRFLQDAQRKLEGNGRKTKAKVMLFGTYGGKSKPEAVADPYYGADDGFGDVFEQVSRFSKNFLKDVVDKP